MELSLYYNGKMNRYIISKYVRRFILPLDEVQTLLCEGCTAVADREQRRGRVVNDVINVNKGSGGVVVPIAEVTTAVRCLAKRMGNQGFSHFVFGDEYPVVDAGYLTLILKTADMLPKHDGYYLNAFWGKPIPKPEVFLAVNYDERKEALEYWDKHAYSGKVIAMNTDTVLFPEKPTPFQLDAVARTSRCHFNYMGRADLDITWHEIWLKADGQYYVYRGVR